MIDRARQKLATEMEADKNPYIHVVGHFLMTHLAKNPGDADKIRTKGKTIKGSLRHMESEACKKKVGNCAVLTDEEGFAIVLDYFGIVPGAVVASAENAGADWGGGIDG